MKQPTTVDVAARRWRDKVNGNSYFSARVTLDFGTATESTHYLPFQYGYGDAHEWAASRLLHGLGIVGDGPLSLSCREAGIILRASIADAKKRDCVEWGNSPA